MPDILTRASPDNNWRMRERLHRCPDCWRHTNCGGNRNHPCGKPYLIKCAEGEHAKLDEKSVDNGY